MEALAYLLVGYPSEIQALFCTVIHAPTYASDKKKQKKLKKNYGCPKKKITSTEKRRQKLSKAVLVEYMLRKFKH